MSFAQRFRLTVLSLSHFTIDCYGAFLGAILVVVLAPRLGLDDDGAARLLSLSVAILSLGQPLFGYLSDRGAGRLLVILSPTVAGLSAGLFLEAPTLPWLLVMIVAQAAAIAAFHPEGTALAGAIDPRRATASTGVFIAAGPVGMTLGPILITWAATRPGTPLWIPMWGVAVSLLLLVSFPAGTAARTRLSGRGGLREALRGRFVPLSLLVALSAIRYFVTTGLTFAVPILLLERLPRDEALAVIGRWLSLFLGGGALGGIVGSMVFGRHSRRRASALVFLAGAILTVAFPFFDGAWAAAVLFAAGLALGWPGPLIVVMGQKAVPRAAAMASALMLGLAWSIGGPAAPVVYQAARGLSSTEGAVFVLAGTSAVAAWIALFLPAELEA